MRLSPGTKSRTNPRVAFRTDGNTSIGLGHLTECLTLAKRLQNHYSVSSLFIISSDTVEIQKLGDFTPATERLTANIGEEDSKLTGQILKKHRINLLVTNLRAVTSDYLNDLKKRGITLVCIDELGNRDIIADVVINGSIVGDWHRYQFQSQSTLTYFGPEYMIMDKAFGTFHQKEKPIKPETTNILVTMGGVDRSGATLRIIEALNRLDKKIRKSIVVGPAFHHRSKLEELLPRVKENNFQMSYVPANMAELMFEVDLALSAGGNTLYELACVGTPSMVLYEDEHEGIQGRVFDRERAAICLGKGSEVPQEQITASVSSLLRDQALRTEMSQNGKRLVDGKGTERVCDIILDKLK